MRRVVALLVCGMLLLCVCLAYAETTRQDVAKEYSSLCLKMANEYLKECDKTNPDDKYVMLLFHYYFAYKETNAINLLETALSWGDPFGDSKMIDDMLTNSILDSNIRSEYKDWIRGKGDRDYLITLIGSAVEGINEANAR